MSSFSRSPLSRFVPPLLLLALAPVLRAQGTPGAALSLAEALDRAERGHPALALHAFDLRAADGLVAQAGARPNPTLEVEAENVAGTGALRSGRGFEATVQASQTWERGEKRERRVALATRGREAAVAEHAVRRAEVRAAAAGAFVAVAEAQARLALAAEPLRLAREVAADAAARVREGFAAAAEEARTRAAVAVARGEVLRAEADLTAARGKLAATWGGTAGDVGRVAATLAVPPALPDAAALDAKLLRHPRLVQQQAAVESRRAALELERAQATQDITLGGGLRFVRDGSDAGLVAGLSVPLPVRQRNQGGIRAARETLAGAEQAARVVEAELRTALAAAWHEVAAGHAQVLNLRREALPPAGEAHALVRRAYRDGQLPLGEVLEAQRALVTLRREILETEAAWFAALVRAEALADATFPLTTTLLLSR